MSGKPKPHVSQLAPGKHAICACGRTDTPPLCDGSHVGSGIAPRILDVDETGRTIAWCTCRRSDDLPMCDGSHLE